MAVGWSPTANRVLERETRLELATACLEGRSSTTELLPRDKSFRYSFRVKQQTGCSLQFLIIPRSVPLRKRALVTYVHLLAQVLKAEGDPTIQMRVYWTIAQTTVVPL